MTQVDAFTLYEAGKNLFLTGAGGTGKSTVIRDMYRHALTNRKKIQVCATTGCAAILLKSRAQTLHSWAGIGLGGATAMSKVLGNRRSMKRWMETDILIVDEVSMLSDKLFELLDDIGRTVRDSPKPFGGIQVIFSGDFYQLPPVDADFCFESSRWKTTFPNVVQLTTVYRQVDEVYRTLLDEIRHGRLSKASHAVLLAHVRAGEGVTKLVPKRHTAETINTSAYAALPGPEFVFRMSSTRGIGASAEYELSYLKTHVRAEEFVKLKVGARVMCIVNLTPQICNGSQGVVTRFQNGIPVVKFAQCETLMQPHVWESETMPGVTVSQVPLMYAWAITIHKAQGATLDEAEIDVGGDVFECGQTYVALSRLRSLAGLYLTSLDVGKIRLNRKVVEFYASL
jgi:ATP-dependent DNA helicase PIF1